jgi:hypothetical protein
MAAMKTTPDKLRHVMATHELTYADVAALCCVSRKTVESWLATPGSAMWRNMHPRHLMALTYGLPVYLARRKSVTARRKVEAKAVIDDLKSAAKAAKKAKK